jgi:hypothetical protein
MSLEEKSCDASSHTIDELNQLIANDKIAKDHDCESYMEYVVLQQLVAGNTDVLNHIRYLATTMGTTMVTRVSIRAGSVLVLDYLHLHDLHRIDYMDTEIAKLAITYNASSVLAWLHEKGYAFSHDDVVYAISMGGIEALDWLCTNNRTDQTHIAHVDVFSTFIEKRHCDIKRSLALLEWMKTNDLIDHDYVMSSAVDEFRGDFTILQWLYDNGYGDSYDEYIFNYIPAFDVSYGYRVSEEGMNRSIALVEWLIEHGLTRYKLKWSRFRDLFHIPHRKIFKVKSIHLLYPNRFILGNMLLKHNMVVGLKTWIGGRCNISPAGTALLMAYCLVRRYRRKTMMVHSGEDMEESE